VKDHRIDPMPPSRREFLRAGAGATMGLVVGAPSRSLVGNLDQSVATATQPHSPQWVRDLIIYEVAPKGFTSPEGPESGTFMSLKAKMAYLQDLGITGIWLAGHALADSHHFFNIWSAYSVIDVSKLDPSLGTPAQFKSMIDEAHRRGIRIFLDVITHGVMNDSPLTKEHPHWFIPGGTWRMIDYDWYGGHTDLDDWWVKVWSNYVTEYGVDGFRLDVTIFRPDLWERIRQNAAKAGHEIVIFEEGDSVIPGVADFTQRENTISSPQSRDLLNDILVQNVPGFYDRKFGKSGSYQVEIQYADDGSRVKGSTDGQGSLRVHLDGLRADRVTRRTFVYFVPRPDGIPDLQLTVDNVPPRPIEDIVVTDDSGWKWRFHPGVFGKHVAIAGLDPIFALRAPLVVKSPLRISVATLGHGWPSVQLSCHDNGRGIPLGMNPYVAQGSRALFGYSCLLTPMIPVFFSGEEFDATFRPLPGMSPDIYGGKDPGKGQWLYGCMLDWDELHQPEHHAMFEDVKKMIAVRKREARILALLPDRKEPNLKAVPHESDIDVPVPYVRWNGEGAVLVAANRNTNKDAHLKMQIPLTEMGLSRHGSYKVSDLWPGGKTQVLAERDLADFACTVKRDKTPGGGFCVFKMEPNP
jgi:Alpha amylase, catalytic domain